MPSKHASIFWIEFADQWDPKSPWHDKRVRQAAILALDRKQISEVSCLGFCPPTSIIIPRVMDFALQTQAAPYDPDRAKKLLAEAGYPNGIDAGDFVPIPPFLTTAELSVNFLAAVGIRVKIRPTERAAFLTNWREKKLRGLFMTAVGNSGNAASRVAEFYYSKGSYAYGGYPDIDELFLQQAQGARRRQARGDPASDPEPGDRAGDVPADHGLPHAARGGAARGRARARRDAAEPVPGVRGHQAEAVEEISVRATGADAPVARAPAHE